MNAWMLFGCGARRKHRSRLLRLGEARCRRGARHVARGPACCDIQRPMRRKRARLSHVDEGGAARMVDVGAKPETSRQATASAVVRMSAATLALVEGGTGARGKGDVLATARLPGA